jgi:periplasmic protein TonB
MSRLIVYFVLASCRVYAVAQEQPKGDSVPDAQTVSKVVHLDEIYERVEIEPQFANGEFQLQEWLRQNILKARKLNQKLPKGTVKTKLVIEKDGSFGRLTYLAKAKRKLKQETVNLIISMPKWRPAQQNGQAVRAYVTITFEW